MYWKNFRLLTPAPDFHPVQNFTSKEKSEYSIKKAFFISMLVTRDEMVKIKEVLQKFQNKLMYFVQLADV